MNHGQKCHRYFGVMTNFRSYVDKKSIHARHNDVIQSDQETGIDLITMQNHIKHRTKEIGDVNNTIVGRNNNILL